MIVGAFMDVSSCKKCYFGVFRWFCLGQAWSQALRGGKSCAIPRRGHASMCLLRRQTESQRDFVHHRRLAREGALDMTTPHPQSLSPLRRGKPVASRPAGLETLAAV